MFIEINKCLCLSTYDCTCVSYTVLVCHIKSDKKFIHKLCKYLVYNSLYIFHKFFIYVRILARSLLIIPVRYTEKFISG